MMRLLWYPDGTENPWRTWYECQNTKVRAKHDVTMRFLESGHWKEPHFKQMVGNYDSLQEIRITKGVAHRLLGFFDQNTKQFIVVVACSHKGDRYNPRDALETAKNRAKDIKEGRVIVVSCDQPKAAPKSKPIVRNKRR